MFDVVTPARDREAAESKVAAGQDLLKTGNLADAQAAFRDAAAADPDNPRILALLGLTYFRGGQFTEARPIYEQLVERAPTDASHRLNLGLVYLKTNDHEKAITALEASRALDPSAGRAVNYLGLAYARAGRYAEAYRSFLIANQNELAIEIEANLTTAERDGIHSQLGRTPQGPLDKSMPPAPSPSSIGITLPRTVTPAPAPAPTPAPIIEPRTKPPSAPPAARTKSQEVDLQQLSHPEIVIEKLRPDDKPAVPMVAVRSGASAGSAPSPIEPSMSESQVFVLPKSAAPEPAPGRSMISQAIAVVTPAPAPPDGAARTTASGGTPPRPLAELATDELLRPDDGSDPFEISASGALIIRVTDKVLTRLDGVHITGGDLQYELAMRRSRGHITDEKFDYGGTPLHSVSGHGYMVAVPGKLAFSAVLLDDDILYLREDLVFAFESSLRWESGNVPGLRGKLPVVQFRGDGALAVRLARPLVRVKLASSNVVFVDAERLAGWIGRVIPRAVMPPPGGPMGSTCVECTGEGIVLVEPRPESEAVVNVIDYTSAPVLARTPTTPPPPPGAKTEKPAEPDKPDKTGDASGATAEPPSENEPSGPEILGNLDD